MKALLLVVYGLAAFACGVWSRTDRHSENYAAVAFVVVVIVAAALWRL